jgi:hypothetical protein
LLPCSLHLLFTIFTMIRHHKCYDCYHAPFSCYLLYLPWSVIIRVTVVPCSHPLLLTIFTRTNTIDRNDHFLFVFFWWVICIFLYYNNLFKLIFTLPRILILTFTYANNSLLSYLVMLASLLTIIFINLTVTTYLQTN